jgi:Domain of unknown function (DUF4386)
MITGAGGIVTGPASPVPCACRRFVLDQHHRGRLRHRLRSRRLVHARSGDHGAQHPDPPAAIPIGLAAHLVVTLTNVPFALIFYELFKVVNRRLALLTAFFILVATAIEAAGLVHEFAPLALLGSGPYASVLPPAQLEALASLPGALSDGGYHVYTTFFGLDILCLAYLVLQSRFVPVPSASCWRSTAWHILPTASRISWHQGSPPIWSPGSSCPHPSLRGPSASGFSYSESTPSGGRREPTRQPTWRRAASRAFAGAADVPAAQVAG